MNRDALLLGSACLVGAAGLLFWNTANASPAGGAVGGSTASGNGFPINNPGNIRYIAPPNNFNGQTGQTASGIGIYDTLQNGLRAMFLQLQDYINDGLDTITQIVTTYAPPSENPTAQYIANVSAAVGIQDDAPLAWPGEAPELMQAMIQQENGTVNGLTQASIQTYLQNAGVYSA